MTAKVISRGRGQSMVAAAAYRMGAALRDERYGVMHNYVGKRGVAHAEILAPADAPGWVRDRELLWNRVEAGESRKDSQLARLIEIGLPIELGLDENVALLRDYIETEFASKGMVADYCVRLHSDNPHSHILLTLRQATSAGFGPKERRWNGKAALLQWRAAWAERANEHLARAGHLVRIDHRTLEAQQIELTPGRKAGVGKGRRSDENLPGHLSDRISEQQQLAAENGNLILNDPAALLRALTHQRPIFSDRELGEFLRFRTQGEAQFDAAYRAVTQSPEFVALNSADAGEGRFTSRDMVEAEKSLLRRTASMAARPGHGVAAPFRNSAAGQFSMDDEQRSAYDYLLDEGDIKALLIAAGTAKATLLRVARYAYESAGLAAMGASPSLREADELEAASGIPWKNLGSREDEWMQRGSPGAQAHALPSRVTVLFIDGAETLGLKQLERVLAVADRARAKIVLIGDPARLRAMRVETPFHAVFRAVGLAERPN